jgi:ribosomal protein S18 acetylase RimI-like enzyme
VTLVIRAFQPADFDRLLAIEHAVFPPAIAYPRLELRRFLSSRRCRTLVAEEEGEVAGFVTGCCEEGEEGLVASLDVAPERQGQGIGSRLLAAMEEWLRGRGARVLRLETPTQEGEGARRFYERHGYAVEERLTDYYGGGLDAFRMLKRAESGKMTA